MKNNTKHIARKLMSQEEIKAHKAPFLSKAWQKRKEDKFMIEDAKMTLAAERREKRKEEKAKAHKALLNSHKK